MTKLTIHQGDWVVVCDGRKALVLENAGDEKFPNLKTREVMDQPNQKNHEIGSDAPGRSFSSVGHGRSAMEQTDWHTLEEERFLKALATRLDADVKAGRVKSIVMVAPPRALGVLRPAYGHDLQRAIIGEIDKDLVALPVHEIEKRLT